MNLRTVFIGAILVSAWLTDGWAQAGQSAGATSGAGWVTPTPSHKLEISPYGGYLWSGSVDVQVEDELGKLDLKSGPMWGIEVDINVMPGGQAVLLYQRQETELTYQPNRGAKETVGDMTVEFWQVGALGGTQNGNVMGFGLITLGATRLVPQFTGANDVWKFSFIFGVGAKIY